MPMTVVCSVSISVDVEKNKVRIWRVLRASKKIIRIIQQVCIKNNICSYKLKIKLCASMTSAKIWSTQHRTKSFRQATKLLVDWLGKTTAAKTTTTHTQKANDVWKRREAWRSVCFIWVKFAPVCVALCVCVCVLLCALKISFYPLKTSTGVLSYK